MTTTENCDVCGAKPRDGEVWLTISRWRFVRTPAGHEGTDPEGFLVGHVRCLLERLEEKSR